HFLIKGIVYGIRYFIQILGVDKHPSVGVNLSGLNRISLIINSRNILYILTKIRYGISSLDHSWQSVSNRILDKPPWIYDHIYFIILNIDQIQLCPYRIIGS